MVRIRTFESAPGARTSERSFTQFFPAGRAMSTHDSCKKRSLDYRGRGSVEKKHERFNQTPPLGRSLPIRDRSSQYLSCANEAIMPQAEWRLFLPNVDVRRPPAEARPLMALLDHVPPALRTDVYLKADADVGIKRRVSQSCERARGCSAARALKESRRRMQ